VTRARTLLHTYVANRGLFARVAKQLGMDPSYVSRVANGKRHSEKVSLAIEAELNKMHRKVAQSSGKKSPRPAAKKSLRTRH